MKEKIVVQVIGDCHTARISGHHTNLHLDTLDKSKPDLQHYEEKNSKFLLDSNIEINFWGLAGFKCFGIDIQENIVSNTLSSLPEDAYDIPGFTDNVELRYGFAKSLEADIIMPWMGYVDCRNWLYKYNNTSLIVHDYLSAFKDLFSDKKIRYIEPFPQFEDLDTHNYNSVNYDIRQKSDVEFREHLNINCEKYGYLPPISQSIVYDAIGSSKLTKEHARSGNSEFHNNTLIDALKFEYNKQVYINLVDQIKKTVLTLEL